MELKIKVNNFGTAPCADLEQWAGIRKIPREMFALYKRVITALKNLVKNDRNTVVKHIWPRKTSFQQVLRHSL